MFTTAHPDLCPIEAGATRRGAVLDEVYTNMHSKVSEKLIQKPLISSAGIESDHSIVAASFGLPKTNKSSCTSFTFRPITKDGVDKFKEIMIATDWSLRFKSNANESALRKS